MAADPSQKGEDSYHGKLGDPSAFSFDNLGLLALPTELLLQILSYLSPGDLKRISLVSRELREVGAHDFYIWKELFWRRYRNGKDEAKRLRYNQSMGWKALFHWRYRSACRGLGELPSSVRCRFNPMLHVSEHDPTNHLRLLQCMFFAPEWFIRFISVSERAYAGMRRLASWSLLFVALVPVLQLAASLSLGTWHAPEQLSVRSSWGFPLLWAVSLSLSLPTSFAHVFASGGHLIALGALALWLAAMVSSELVPFAVDFASSLFSAVRTYAVVFGLSWSFWVLHFVLRHRRLPFLSGGRKYSRNAGSKLFIISFILFGPVMALRYWVATGATLLFIVPIALVQQEASFVESAAAMRAQARKAPALFMRGTASCWFLVLLLANLYIAFECFLLHALGIAPAFVRDLPSSLAWFEAPGGDYN